jgi:hypothetical protein
LFFFIQKRIPVAGDVMSILPLGVSITAMTSSALTLDPFEFFHRPSHILFRHRGMPIQPIFGNLISATILIFLQILTVPLFPLVASTMGWFHCLKAHAWSPGRGFHPNRAMVEFTPAMPLFAYSAQPLAAVEIHGVFS